jgi:hypothetical protein
MEQPVSPARFHEGILRLAAKHGEELVLAVGDQPAIGPSRWQGRDRRGGAESPRCGRPPGSDVARFGFTTV